jgi:hypothetical protein
MTDQVSDPPGVLHVGLAPRHALDVAGVGKDQGEVPFQQGEDGHPVDAGALHADMGDAQPLQPVTQGFQVGGHGAEVA